MHDSSIPSFNTQYVVSIFADLHNFSIETARNVVWSNLSEEILMQVFSPNGRNARNIVNPFFWINRRELSSEFVTTIHKTYSHVAESCIVSSKQSDRTTANDNCVVAFDQIHVLHICVHKTSFVCFRTF